MALALLLLKWRSRRVLSGYSMVAFELTVGDEALKLAQASRGDVDCMCLMCVFIWCWFGVVIDCRPLIIGDTGD